MIRYALQCQKGHRFDGWFRDSKLADRQLRQGKVECAACGIRKVEKALMAPRLGKNMEIAIPAETMTPPVDTADPVSVSENMPAEIGAKMLLRGLRKYIEKNFDDVGAGFAEEARKIHYGESSRKAIYGQASAKEHRALYEEGIEIGTIPWIPESDA